MDVISSRCHERCSKPAHMLHCDTDKARVILSHWETGGCALYFLYYIRKLQGDELWDEVRDTPVVSIPHGNGRSRGALLKGPEMSSRWAESWNLTMLQNWKTACGVTFRRKGRYLGAYSHQHCLVGTKPKKSLRRNFPAGVNTNQCSLVRSTEPVRGLAGEPWCRLLDVEPGSHRGLKQFTPNRLR